MYEELPTWEVSGLGPDAPLEARIAYLHSAPARGWEDEALLEQVIRLTAYSGVRIENYRLISYSPEPDAEDEDTVMMWRHSSGNLEIFPRYADGEMLTRLMHNIHEGGHACSPFNPANSAYFGGETGRIRAVAYIRAVASQCTLTGIYFNEYHTKLAEKLKLNIIDDACFEEETWAILLEQSLAAPFSSWLEQTEASQRKELAKLRRLYPKDAYPEAVELYLNLRDDKPRGIGAHLTSGMLYGVHDQISLKQHIRWLNDARRKDLQAYETRGDVFERAVGRIATFCATLNAAIGHARIS